MRKVHYHLLDVLKLFVLFSIQTLHVYEFIFYKDDVLLDGLSSVYIYTQYFARVFSLGGQILVAIIFFFFGFNSKTRSGLLKIAAFALFGQFVIACAFVEEGGVLQSLEWDIYAFIALTNVILALLPEKKRRLLWLPFFSFLVLWVPPAFWQGLCPEGTFFDILSGRLGPHNSGAWAPLPWFFHSLLFFSLGSWFKDHRDLLKVFQKGELIVWGFLLLLCLSHFGAYFQTPIGPHYYSFNFSRSPFIYWANFLPFVFWMRVSFLDTIQGRLSTWSIFPWLSQLAWTRHVGLTYVLAIIYVGIGAQFDEAFARIPYAFDLFYLSIMPVVELIARGLLSWRHKWRTLPDETSSRS